MTNETGLPRKRTRRLQTLVQRNEKYKKRVYTLAAQIQIKTKSMVRQTQSRLESRKTAGSFPLIYYVMCLTFYLQIFS